MAPLVRAQLRLPSLMAPMVGRRGVFTMQHMIIVGQPRRILRGPPLKEHSRHEACHMRKSRPAMPLCPVDFQLQSAT